MLVAYCTLLLMLSTRNPRGSAQTDAVQTAPNDVCLVVGASAHLKLKLVRVGPPPSPNGPNDFLMTLVAQT